MTNEEIRKAIYDKVEETWSNQNTIAWPNHAFNVPQNEIWCRPNVLMGETSYGELGRGSNSGVGIRSGVLMIQVFAPINTGSKTINEQADAFEAAFRRQTIEGIVFDEPHSYVVGVDLSPKLEAISNYYQVNVQVEFRTFVGE